MFEGEACSHPGPAAVPALDRLSRGEVPDRAQKTGEDLSLLREERGRSGVEVGDGAGGVWDDRPSEKTSDDKARIDKLDPSALFPVPAIFRSRKPRKKWGFQARRNYRKY